MSLLRILVLTIAFAQASGMTDALIRASCTDDCRDDGGDAGCSDEDCVPCPSCLCAGRCATGVPAMAITAPSRPSVVSPADFIDGDGEPASPDPHEILHVPRSVTG